MTMTDERKTGENAGGEEDQSLTAAGGFEEARHPRDTKGRFRRLDVIMRDLRTAGSMGSGLTQGHIWNANTAIAAGDRTKARTELQAAADSTANGQIKSLAAEATDRLKSLKVSKGRDISNGYGVPETDTIHDVSHPDHGHIGSIQKVKERHDVVGQTNIRIGSTSRTRYYADPNRPAGKDGNGISSHGPDTKDFRTRAQAAHHLAEVADDRARREAGLVSEHPVNDLTPIDSNAPQSRDSHPLPYGAPGSRWVAPAPGSEVRASDGRTGIASGPVRPSGDGGMTVPVEWNPDSAPSAPDTQVGHPDAERDAYGLPVGELHPKEAAQLPADHADRAARLTPYAQTGPDYNRAIADNLATYRRLVGQPGREHEAAHWLRQAEASAGGDRRNREIAGRPPISDSNIPAAPEAPAVPAEPKPRSDRMQAMLDSAKHEAAGSPAPSVHLQGIGKHPAKPVSEFKPGDKVVHNYGETSTVVSNTKMSPPSGHHQLIVRDKNGKEYTNRRAGTTLLGHREGTPPEAPAESAPNAPAAPEAPIPGEREHPASAQALRDSGFKVGDRVQHNMRSRDHTGKVSQTVQPHVHEIAGVSRNGNAVLRHPETGSTYHAPINDLIKARPADAPSAPEPGGMEAARQRGLQKVADATVEGRARMNAPAAPAADSRVTSVPSEPSRQGIKASDLREGDQIAHPKTGEPVTVTSARTHGQPAIRQTSVGYTDAKGSRRTFDSAPNQVHPLASPAEPSAPAPEGSRGVRDYETMRGIANITPETRQKMAESKQRSDAGTLDHAQKEFPEGTRVAYGTGQAVDPPTHTGVVTGHTSVGLLKIRSDQTGKDLPPSGFQHPRQVTKMGAPSESAPSAEEHTQVAPGDLQPGDKLTMDSPRMADRGKIRDYTVTGHSDRGGRKFVHMQADDGKVDQVPHDHMPPAVHVRRAPAAPEQNAPAAVQSPNRAMPDSGMGGPVGDTLNRQAAGRPMAASEDPGEIDSLASDGTQNAMDLGYDASTPEGESADSVFEAIQNTDGSAQQKIEAGIEEANRLESDNPQGREGALAVLRSVMHADGQQAEHAVPVGGAAPGEPGGGDTPRDPRGGLDPEPIASKYGLDPSLGNAMSEVYDELDNALRDEQENPTHHPQLEPDLVSTLEKMQAGQPLEDHEATLVSEALSTLHDDDPSRDDFLQARDEVNSGALGGRPNDLIALDRYSDEPNTPDLGEGSVSDTGYPTTAPATAGTGNVLPEEDANRLLDALYDDLDAEREDPSDDGETADQLESLIEGVRRGDNLAPDEVNYAYGAISDQIMYARDEGDDAEVQRLDAIAAKIKDGALGNKPTVDALNRPIAPSEPDLGTDPVAEAESPHDMVKNTWGDTPWSQIPADYKTTGPGGERRVLARTRDGGTTLVPWTGGQRQPDNSPEIGSPPVGGISNADKIDNAAKMYGHGSPQHRAAIDRFGKPKTVLGPRDGGKGLPSGTSGGAPDGIDRIRSASDNGINNAIDEELKRRGLPTSSERAAMRDSADGLRNGRSAKMQRAFRAASEGDHQWLSEHGFDAQPGDSIHAHHDTGFLGFGKPDGSYSVQQVNGNGGAGRQGMQVDPSVGHLPPGFEQVHDPGASGVPSDIGGEAEKQALRDRVAQANGGRSAKAERAFRAAREGDHAWLASHGFNAGPNTEAHIDDANNRLAFKRTDGTWSAHGVNGNGQATSPSYVGKGQIPSNGSGDLPEGFVPAGGPQSPAEPPGATNVGAEANRATGETKQVNYADASARIDAALRDSGNANYNADTLDSNKVRIALADPNGSDAYVTVKPPGGYEVSISRADAEALLRARRVPIPPRRPKAPAAEAADLTPTSAPAVAQVLKRAGIMTSHDRKRQSVRVSGGGTGAFAGPVRISVDYDNPGGRHAQDAADSIEKALSDAGYTAERDGTYFTVKGRTARPKA